jgi:hypothetical protein
VQTDKHGQKVEEGKRRRCENGPIGRRCKNKAIAQIRFKGVTLSERLEEVSVVDDVFLCAKHANQFMYGKDANAYTYFEQGYGVQTCRVWLLVDPPKESKVVESIAEPTKKEV